MIFWQGQLVKLVSFSHQISWIFQFIIEKIIFMSWVWDDVGNENLASLLLFRLILQPLDIYQASRYRSKKVLLDHYCKRKKRKEGESPVKTVIEPFHCVLSNKKSRAYFYRKRTDFLLLWPSRTTTVPSFLLVLYALYTTH